MSTTEGKDSKDEKSPRESSAAAVDIPVAKRKGAKRKQQDTSSHPEATKKQAK